jgi:serine/threonine-protein kinase
VSARTDIYSVGVVAYELLSGQVPFDRGSSVKTLMAHVNEPVPRLAQIHPGSQVSAAMEGIVLRCLRKNPDERYASIDELLAALAEIEGGAGVLNDSRLSLPIVEPPSLPGRAPPLESGSYPHRRSSPPALPGGDADDEPTRPTTPPVVTDPPTSGPLMPSATPAPMEKLLVEVTPPRPRRGLALAGVALAAAAVGAIAFVASRSPETAPADATAPPRTELPTTTPSAAEAAARSLRVTSTPDGATVEEAGAVVCEATPCELYWEGAAAQEEHALTFRKPGFATRTMTVAPADVSAATTLEAEPPSQVVGSKPIAPQSPGAPAPASAKPEAPEGYKDSPY